MKKLILIVCLAISGCATPYQDMGFTGGVTAQQMTANTFRIISRGNSYTSPTTIQDYTMLRAAETTLQNGGTHFQVISAADASSTAQIVTGGTARTTFVGNTATTHYDPPMVQNLFKPGQDAYIRVIKLAPGQVPPPDAVSAEEIVQFVGPRVQRPKA